MAPPSPRTAGRRTQRSGCTTWWCVGFGSGFGFGFYSCVAMLQLLRLHGGHVHCHLSLSVSLSHSLPLAPHPTTLRAHIPDVDGGLVFVAPRLGPSSYLCNPPLPSLPDHVRIPSRPCRLRRRSVEQRSLSAGCRGSGSWGNLSLLRRLARTQRGVRRRGCRAPDRLDRRPLAPFDVGRNEGKLVNGRALFHQPNPT